MEWVVGRFRESQCRQFTDDEMVQDFDAAKFYGNWFPLWTSLLTPYLFGQCPIVYFEELKLRSQLQAKRAQRIRPARDMF